MYSSYYTPNNNSTPSIVVTIINSSISVKGYRTQDTDTEIEKLYTAVSHTSKLLDQMQLLSKRYKELYDVYKLLLTDESFIGISINCCNSSLH